MKRIIALTLIVVALCSLGTGSLSTELAHEETPGRENVTHTS